MESLTTQNLKSCSLFDLEKNERQAAFYTAYFEPKTQVEAIKLIYGVDDTSNTNYNPITAARGKLLENKFIVNFTPNALGNPVYRSTVTPIINNIKMVEAKRRSRIEIRSDYISALERIIDSDWFRGFYSQDFLKSNWNPHTEQFYHVYRHHISKISSKTKILPDKTRVKIGVPDPVALFTDLMSDIAACSWELTRLLKNHGFEIPTIKEIIDAESFDFIIDQRNKNIPVDLIDLYFNSLTFLGNQDHEISSPNFTKRHKSGEYPFLPKKISDHMKKGLMFIPTDVSARMRYSGRVPITIMEELPYVVSSIEKKLSPKSSDELIGLHQENHGKPRFQRLNDSPE
jgi:hypothetical protein